VHEYSDDDGTGGGGGGGDDDGGGDDEASAAVVVQWRWQRRSQRRPFWGHARCAAAAMALAKEVTRLPTAWATAFVRPRRKSFARSWRVQSDAQWLGEWRHALLKDVMYLFLIKTQQAQFVN
jgi:hypothetical protein